jgi:hypothetical protein
MRANEFITEAFDNPYKGKWEKSDYGDVDLNTKLPDGTNLSIMFNNQQDDDGQEVVQVEFYRNNSQEVTGEGDAQRIFATVLNAIQKYIKKYKPSKLSFSASKATDPTIYYEPDQPQPNPESRAKLYDRLVQRYAKAWGYRAFRADNGDLVIYELSRLKQGVAEGKQTVTEYRDRMYQYLKSIVPNWPDYIVKDWLYANFAKGETYNKEKGWSFATVGKDIPMILKDMGLSVDTNWQLVPNMKFTMDMWEPKTLKRLQARAGGNAKSADPAVHIPARDAERHATQAALAKQQGGVRKEPVILMKTTNGYELLEGWHRTIQHFHMYPDGYTGPAYVAVAQGQQDVAEARGLAPTKPYDDLMANMGYFMSLNTVKIQQDAIDSDAQQELANMQQQFRKPILNGMSFFDVNRDIKISKNPKVAPILLKYVYDMIGYIEPRLKTYIKPEQQGKYLDRLNQIKNDYRAAIAQVS